MICVCINGLLFSGMLLSDGRGLFLALSAAGQERGPWVHYDACLGADLPKKHKGLLSASPRRVGDMENPTFFFVNSPPPSDTTPAVHMFPTSAEEAAADMQQQQEYTSVGCRIFCTKPFDGSCTPNTENVRDHNVPSTWNNVWYS